MGDLKWYRLRSNQCPSCAAELVKDEGKFPMIRCSKCDFKIGEKKMEALVVKQNATARDDLAHEPDRDGWSRFEE